MPTACARSGATTPRARSCSRWTPSAPARRAVATIASDTQPKAGEFALLRETVIVDVGEKHLRALDTIVDPLVVTDLPTVLWSPHGHPEAVDVMLDLAQVVLLDSSTTPTCTRPSSARANSCGRPTSSIWRGCAPRPGASAWRPRSTRRICAPTCATSARSRCATTRIRRRRRCCSRLAGLAPGLAAVQAHRAATGPWRAGARQAPGRGAAPRARGHPERPGLAGLTLETASGRHLELDRGPGGLHARYRNNKGDERDWTILGASRGEAGILGEGIRQALLRDPTYGPALDAANALAP